MKIWEKTKTEIEIQADTLACFTGNESGLVAWYNFENNSSSTLVDVSGSNNHGNYMNFEAFNFTERIYTCHEPSPTSLAENVKEKIALYPNPTQGELTIEMNGFKPTQISIIDITGKQLLNGLKIRIQLMYRH